MSTSKWTYDTKMWGLCVRQLIHILIPEITETMNKSTFVLIDFLFIRMFIPVFSFY